eukprot:185208-Pyramimonas_sp.AAC.1
MSPQVGANMRKWSPRSVLGDLAGSEGTVVRPWGRVPSALYRRVDEHAAIPARPAEEHQVRVAADCVRDA